MCGIIWHAGTLSGTPEKDILWSWHGQGGESLNTDSAKELEELCKNNLLTELAEQYISRCYEESADSHGETGKSVSKTKAPKFPNLAGFCRYLGVGTDDFEAVREKYPGECGAVCAALEDEALNSGNSATLISAYMKQRLGYGKAGGEPKYSCESEKYELVFEHDIFDDGG